MKELETAVEDEPSVFEPLKSHYTSIWSLEAVSLPKNESNNKMAFPY